jgi:serine phosphatase RsbU (regulator of sigma subunit)
MTHASSPALATALAEVARALQAERTPQATLQKMVDLAVSTVAGCDHAGVSLIGPDGIATPAASDDVPRLVDDLQYESNEGPCLSAIREQDMYVTADLGTESRWPAFATRATQQTGVRSMLSFRLFVERANLGALNLYSRRPDAFDESSIAVGRLFAAHAAIALSDATEQDHAERRADLFEKQATIAVRLQRSMLTPLPDLSPFTAAARYVPAVEAAEVGGDWYDALVLPSGDLLLIVGDVVGHDTDAATAMAQVRTALRVLAVNHDEPPSALLARLDETLDRLDQFHVGTCAVVRLTHRDGAWFASFAAAGHPPPLRITGGATHFVDLPADLILGAARHTPRHTTVIPVRPGTTLLLYTDGLVERRDRPLTDGLAALGVAAAALGGDDVDELCDALLRELAGAPTDDVCLLAVRLPEVR